MGDITSDFVDRILELASTELKEIGGRQYASRGLIPVKPPVVDAFIVHTLTGLADYLGENPDNIERETIIVHVGGHKCVSVFSRLADEWGQRHRYIQAGHEPKAFAFGQYLSVENFIVALQTYFVPNEATEVLTKIVGNLSADTTVKVVDDGISQEVQARSGIARVADVQLPNPVTFAPYRTFLEITQPESQFLFRMKKEPSGGVTCALFEADGGNWQLEAVKRIRDWLRANLPAGMTIIA